MIVFENVSYRAGNKQILKNFSFSVKKGEKVLVYGKSGSGKTSVLRLILGFARPGSGRIMFKGGELGPQRVKEVRKSVSYVPQELSMGRGAAEGVIKEILGFGANAGNEFSRKKLKRFAGIFGLDSGVIDTDISDISGGEKQRLNIILSLMLSREIFLLDEITSALDKKTKKTVIDYFMNKKKWTCICVSHDPGWLRAENIRVVRIGGKNGGR